jgi:hypothetical protein
VGHPRFGKEAKKSQPLRMTAGERRETTDPSAALGMTKRETAGAFVLGEKNKKVIASQNDNLKTKEGETDPSLRPLPGSG